jgi:5'-3' exoribonuclease 2
LDDELSLQCITPGTRFMNTVALWLRNFILHKMETDPAWGKIKIILSDSSVPGIAFLVELKVIRRGRTQNNEFHQDAENRGAI